MKKINRSKEGEEEKKLEKRVKRKEEGGKGRIPIWNSHWGEWRWGRRGRCLGRGSRRDGISSEYQARSQKRSCVRGRGRESCWRDGRGRSYTTRTRRWTRNQRSHLGCMPARGCVFGNYLITKKEKKRIRKEKKKRGWRRFEERIKTRECYAWKLLY